MKRRDLMGTLVIEIVFVLFGLFTLISAFMYNMLGILDLLTISIIQQIYLQLCYLTGIVLIGFAVIFNILRKY